MLDSRNEYSSPRDASDKKWADNFVANSSGLFIAFRPVSFFIRRFQIAEVAVNVIRRSRIKECVETGGREREREKKRGNRRNR